MTLVVRSPVLSPWKVEWSYRRVGCHYNGSHSGTLGLFHLERRVCGEIEMGMAGKITKGRPLRKINWHRVEDPSWKKTIEIPAPLSFF